MSSKNIKSVDPDIFQLIALYNRVLSAYNKFPMLNWLIKYDDTPEHFIYPETHYWIYNVPTSAISDGLSQVQIDL